MKIVLVNPPYESLSGIKESGGRALPLNLAYLAASIKRGTRWKVEVLDAEVRRLSHKKIVERFEEDWPEVIGITCPTPAFNQALKIARNAKRVCPGVVVVLGGVHPTAFPKETIKEDCVDVVVVGEGDDTIVEVLNNLGMGMSLKGIRGTLIKEGEKVIDNGERELISNLDLVPFPDRDSFDMSLYFSAPTKRLSNHKSSSIITSRGCPYSCTHCISQLVWKGRVRNRSVQNVVDEIQECVEKFGIREFNFYDDTFTINPVRVKSICREIRKRKLRIVWLCMGRANTINREMVREMKKAGCKKISFGFESGSQKVLDLMNKRCTLEQAREAVKIVKKEGLEVHSSFMLGNVGETEQTIKETIDFAKDLKLDNATFFITSPFPGTKLYEVAKEKGFINEGTVWEDFAPITSRAPVLVQGNLSQEALVRWQKRAFKKFYFNLGYAWRRIKKLRNLGEVKNLFVGLGIFLRVQKKTA